MDNMLFVASVLMGSTAAVAGVPQPPFSWHTVPVFAETSNVSGVFDDEAMGVLRRFPLFVAEKAYDFPAAGFAEDKLAALAKAFKSGGGGNSPFLVFYYNANLDLTDYRLHATFAARAPSWWLRNSSNVPFIAPIDAGAGTAGAPFPYNGHGGGVPVYDHTVPAARAAWVQECFDMRAAGFDGCMVDRWTRTPFKGGKAQYEALGYTEAQVDAWVAAMALSTGALLNRTRDEGTYLVGEGPGVDASSYPGYGGGALKKGGAALQQQLALAAGGQGLLASYKPGTWGGAAFETQLACFLVGAAPGHFFGAGSWTVGHTSREGVTWHPEYDLPLGEPLGNATVAALPPGPGHIYTRRFAYGTNVSYDSSTAEGHIQWGTFPGIS